MFLFLFVEFIYTGKWVFWAHVRDTVEIFAPQRSVSGKEACRLAMVVLLIISAFKCNAFWSKILPSSQFYLLSSYPNFPLEATCMFFYLSCKFGTVLNWQSILKPFKICIILIRLWSYTHFHKSKPHCIQGDVLLNRQHMQLHYMYQ